MTSYDNYIEEYVMSLPGVEERRTFNSVGESENTFTYGNRTTAIESINRNKAKDKNSDRLKEIHRLSIKDRDITTTVGKIWVEMDQDDERMNRYLFPNRTDKLEGETNIRDLTHAMNNSTEQKVIDLIELLTTKTIAPSGEKWTLYDTDKPLYGFEIESIDLTSASTPVAGSIIAQINTAVGAGNYDDAGNRSFTGFTLPATIPKASVWSDGIEANRQIGLSSTKFNIYSYVKITTNNNSTGNTYDYYYIPTEANFTTTENENADNFVYYHQLYPRYHIVDSEVNNMSHPNAFQYNASFPIKWTDTGSTSKPAVGRDLSTVLSESDKTDLLSYINGETYTVTEFLTNTSIKDFKFNYNDYILNSTGGNYWTINCMAINTAKLGKKYILNVLTGGQTGANDIPSIAFEYGDYYKVGRTVWMVSRSADEHNNYLKQHQTKVRSVRLNAIKTKDSLQTKSGQIWVKMNKNDPKNSKYYYPEITPIKWTDTGSNVRPTVGKDLSNVLATNAQTELLSYVNTATFTLSEFVTKTLIKDFKFNYDDYILNTTGGNYWTINYEESRKLAGDTVSTTVQNFLKDNTIINDGSVDTSYILNSKTDFDTQNVLMDSKLVKQYGDTYVLLSDTDIPTNIKYGDYYDSDSTSLFGYKWILTNQTKKLDYGRELYDFDLTNMLRGQIADVNALPSEIDITTPLGTSLVFTQTDLDNLNIKSLDYIYVVNDGSEDIYYKAIENNGVFDGKKWKLIEKGAVPNFGRQLYHQNLSDLLTNPTNDIVTLTSTQYDNNNLDKLNLQTSDYIIGADNTTAYRPMPVYIWLATRSTENQHVYDKHHQITINDTKNEALNIKQTSDVPGQLWKKMSLTDSKNSGFYYPVITPLHWETHNNGATKPEKGRNLSEILTTTQLSQLVAYVNTGTYDLDTFNSNAEIIDFEFYYDDYVQDTTVTDPVTPHKYYTIDYNASRDLNTKTTSDGSKRLNLHTTKYNDELINFLVDNNFEGYKENYNYPFDKYYANIINSTRDSKTNRIIVYGDEYVLLDHRDVPNRIIDDNGLPVVKPNNIKYGDFYKKDDDNIWLAVRSNDVQYAFNNTVDTDIKEIRNTAKDVRRTTNHVGQIWIKMLENDKRMSKYNFQNMVDGTSRPYYVWKSIDKAPEQAGYWITKDNGLTWNTVSIHDPLESVLVTDPGMKGFLLTAIEDPSIIIASTDTILVNFKINTMQSFEKFLKNNIDIYENNLQKSYIVDSLVDSKTNRITKYGNEYIVFENHLIPNQMYTLYGQYYQPEDFTFGTKWSLIGTEKPTSGRLLVLDDITNNGTTPLNGTNNTVTIDTTATHETINGIAITIQNRLDELELTPDDYIAGLNGTFYKAIPPYRWLVTRSDDEDYHYKTVRDIRLKDVLHEAEKVRQSSTRIGQIWVVMDPTDERISLTKFPNRRKLSNNTITASSDFDYLLNNFDKKVTVVNGSNDEIYQKEFKVDNRVYNKNTYSVVDSIVDKNTYEITYDDDATNRSGLGTTLVLLDTRDIPSLDSSDGDADGYTLRYGDYYVRDEDTPSEKWVVVTRSHDVQHAKDESDAQKLQDERDAHLDNEASALQNDYQFSVVDDRIGRLWQEVTAVPILDTNKKLIEHDATEALLDAGTIELSREQLNTLLSDFTFTKILSTKYMQHRTTNGVFYVTIDNGTTWQQVSQRPVVGIQVYHTATSAIFEGGTFTLTATQLNALTKDAIDSDFNSNVYDIFTDADIQLALDNVADGDYTILTETQKTKVTNASAAILSTTANKWYLTEDNGANWIVKVNGTDPIIVSSTTVEFDSDNHNTWHEHNKRNRYYTTQYLKKNSDYFISNDYGYNWVKVTENDITNMGSSSALSTVKMGYEIVHEPTLDILTGANGQTERLLLTSSELDDLLNMAKYASSHGVKQTSDDDSLLAGEYVSHRLLTRYHYIKSGTKYYIPGKYINEDYKNYISFPGKGKLGRYWRLRDITYFTGFTEITQSAVVTGADANAKTANFTKFMNILEGNDGSYDSNGNLVVPDPERDSNLEPRLVLTQVEKDAIFGLGTTISATHYVQHRVNAIDNANIPDVYYISQDNGLTWQKLTQVSDVSVAMSNTSQIFNNINETLGKKIKDKFDANSSDGILNLDFEDFVNYEVESNVRENSYIVEGSFVFVPGQYVNEEYVYYPSTHEYPSKNDLGRIWMNITTTDPTTIDAAATQYSNTNLETLLAGFSSANNNVTTVTIGGTNYEIFSISYQEYANYNVNNISETKYVKSGDNYYIPGRYINEYNDYYPLSPS